MMLEYQVVYNLKSDLTLLQGCLNRMAGDGWTLTYVNANALYAVFQRPTDKPRYSNGLIYVGTLPLPRICERPTFWQAIRRVLASHIVADCG
jgi:hypothetical protein